LPGSVNEPVVRTVVVFKTGRHQIVHGDFNATGCYILGALGITLARQLAVSTLRLSAMAKRRVSILARAGWIPMAAG